MKRLLLDTHLVLWWLAEDRRIGASTRQLIGTSHCAISVVSVAEIHMKVRAGKLRIPPQRLDDQLQLSGIAVLSLTIAHVEAASRLMGRHPDPFDCFLVGTALAEGMTFATRDHSLLDNAASLLGGLLLEV